MNETTATAGEATEATTEVENQVNESVDKMFSQDQLDKIIEDRLSKQRRALERKFDGVDVEHYRQLTSEQEAKQMEAKKARGEFESVLKETVSKKDSAIEQLRNELHTVKVDGALQGVANKLGAINADQVVALLKNQIRLSETGNVEITDNSGQPRYTDSGDPYSVELLVNEFIDTNPHFKKPNTPGGANTVSNLTPNRDNKKINLTELDMTNPANRKLYAEAKAKGLL